MTNPRGGPVLPVTVRTDSPIGGAALPVTLLTSIPADRRLEGGPARPIVYISDAQVAAGYPVQAGDATPIYAVTDGRPTIGGRPQPVYVVGGSGPPAPVYPTGMAARWTLDDASAGYVDLVGGRVLTAGGSGVGTAAGIISNGASFGGAGWLATPSNTVFLPVVGTAYELWVRPQVVDTDGSQVSIIGQVEGTNRRNLVLSQIDSLAHARLFNAAGAFVTASASAFTIANVYKHVVAVVTSTQEIALYINGVLVSTSPALSGTIASFTEVFTIGARFVTATPSSFFRGVMDEPVVWQFGPSGDPGAAFWLDRYNSGAGRRP